MFMLKKWKKQLINTTIHIIEQLKSNTYINSNQEINEKDLNLKMVILLEY